MKIKLETYTHKIKETKLSWISECAKTTTIKFIFKITKLTSIMKVK